MYGGKEVYTKADCQQRVKGRRERNVRKRTWKGNLLRGTLLQEQSVLGVEEEDGKGAVQQALVDVLHEMAYFFACTSNWQVIFVEYYADLVHETNLFLIVTIKVLILSRRNRAGEISVDLGKKAQDVGGGDWLGLGLGLGHSGGGTHVGDCIGCALADVDAQIEYTTTIIAEARGGIQAHRTGLSSGSTIMLPPPESPTPRRTNKGRTRPD